MTKIKMSNQTENNSANGSDFIERRRKALERYLRRTADHPVLVLDPDFREFLESGKKLFSNIFVIIACGIIFCFDRYGTTQSNKHICSQQCWRYAIV